MCKHDVLKELLDILGYLNLVYNSLDPGTDKANTVKNCYDLIDNTFGKVTTQAYDVIDCVNKLKVVQQLKTDIKYSTHDDDYTDTLSYCKSVGDLFK